MQTFTFHVSGEKWAEVEAETAGEAMVIVNRRGLPYGFYGWMGNGPEFSATFGVWD